jgi:hypothetical protein
LNITEVFIANIFANFSYLGRNNPRIQGSADCPSQCSNFCTTTCTSKCTFTTARLSNDNILKLSNTSCSCVCDCACYSPPFTTTSSITTFTFVEIILFPVNINQENQGKLIFNLIFISLFFL